MVTKDNKIQDPSNVIDVFIVVIIILFFIGSHFGAGVR